MSEASNELAALAPWEEKRGGREGSVSLAGYLEPGAPEMGRLRWARATGGE